MKGLLESCGSIAWSVSEARLGDEYRVSRTVMADSMKVYCYRRIARCAMAAGISPAEYLGEIVTAPAAGVVGDDTMAEPKEKWIPAETIS